ncbi:PREDICTED: uncharacterized protein LOC109168122 [Ipomoea nil]|uniref:uncharacterized protein LOC109168122 n=1 Tax=Ipomoea nil TaxID=35883 RepID=UPI0009017101|nr:PREDICTED: uncharacterized protein LOC109168122 [Ipomoea nil]XP_019172716.1 PREDICTED: uncharacterized protein LOC109168122 [Ipomoea nil]
MGSRSNVDWGKLPSRLVYAMLIEYLLKNFQARKLLVSSIGDVEIKIDELEYEQSPYPHVQEDLAEITVNNYHLKMGIKDNYIESCGFLVDVRCYCRVQEKIGTTFL